MDITPGRYRHYKGNEYQVIGTASHSETHERLVIYQSVKDANEFWVRPTAMFAETVTVDGVEHPRFTRLDR